MLDLDADTVVGVLRHTPGVHGVALAPGVDRGYTSNGGDSSLTVFDPRTLAVTGRVRLHADAPDGIVYDPATRRVFALHATSAGLTVVDAGADTVRTTVALGGRPDGGVADGRGRLFVTLINRSVLAVLDTRRLVVEQRWRLAPCVGPDALALDAPRGRLVIGCDNRVAVVVDAATGRRLSSFPIGAGVDGAAVDDDGTILISTGVGRVTVARPSSAVRDGDAGHTRADRGEADRGQRVRYHVMATIPTARGSATSALDTRRHRLYVPAAQLRSNARTDVLGKEPGVTPESFALLVLERRRATP